MDLTHKHFPIAVYIAVLPLFFMAFSLLYDPFHIVENSCYRPMSSEFHLTMMSCIILLVTGVSRTVMFFVRRKKELEFRHNIIWCAAEAFVSSCFVALYIQLFTTSGAGYFQTLALSLKYVYLILVYPYLVLLLLQMIMGKKEAAAQDSSLAKFYDEHGRLKLSIAPSSILFVNAEANYVKIHYAESGKVKDYMLRASMKSIEKMSSENGLLRCQRSYFVNPGHVKVLRKDKDGFYYAELDMPGVQEVPVSKSYFDALSSVL